MRHCSARVLSVWLAITTFLLANPAAAAKLDSQQRAAAFPGYKESASDMQAAAGRWAGAATAAGTARFAAQHPAATGHCRQHPVSYSGACAIEALFMLSKTLSQSGRTAAVGAAAAPSQRKRPQPSLQVWMRGLRP